MVATEADQKRPGQSERSLTSLLRTLCQQERTTTWRWCTVHFSKHNIKSKFGKYFRFRNTGSKISVIDVVVIDYLRRYLTTPDEQRKGAPWTSGLYQTSANWVYCCAVRLASVPCIHLNQLRWRRVYITFAASLYMPHGRGPLCRGRMLCKKLSTGDSLFTEVPEKGWMINGRTSCLAESTDAMRVLKGHWTQILTDFSFRSPLWYISPTKYFHTVNTGTYPLPQ